MKVQFNYVSQDLLSILIYYGYRNGGYPMVCQAREKRLGEEDAVRHM
jgi:hypothetical protein